MPDIEDWEFQMKIWGYAAVGDLPLDPMTYWLESHRRHAPQSLFDLTEDYFKVTMLNGQRPPWWHALLPMTVAAFRKGLPHPVVDA